MKSPIKTFRTEKKLSLDEMAQRIGTTAASLSRIENGKQDIGLAMMLRIVEATNGAVTPNDFMPSPPWKEETAA